MRHFRKYKWLETNIFKINFSTLLYNLECKHMVWKNAVKDSFLWLLAEEKPSFPHLLASSKNYSQTLKKLSGWISESIFTEELKLVSLKMISISVSLWGTLEKIKLEAKMGKETGSLILQAGIQPIHHRDCWEMLKFSSWQCLW